MAFVHSIHTASEQALALLDGFDADSSTLYDQLYVESVRVAVRDLYDKAMFLEAKAAGSPDPDRLKRARMAIENLYREVPRDIAKDVEDKVEAAYSQIREDYVEMGKAAVLAAMRRHNIEPTPLNISNGGVK